MMLDSLTIDWATTMYPYLTTMIIGLMIMITAWMLARLVCIPLQERPGKVRPKWKARLAFFLPALIWGMAIVTLFAKFEMGLNTLTEFIFAGGLIIGLVITPAGSNAIAGFLNAWGDVFRSGEIIEIHGATGRVAQRGLISTRIEAPNGTFYDVPNKLLLDNMVCNFTRNKGYRIEVVVAIDDFDFDLSKTKAVLERVIAQEKWNAQGERAFVLFDEIAPNSYNFRVYAWLNSRADVVPMQGILLEECYLALNQAGISAGQTSFLATKRFAVTDSWENTPAYPKAQWRVDRALAANEPAQKMPQPHPRRNDELSVPWQPAHK